MKKYIICFLFILTPLSVTAEKWDFNAVWTLKECTMIKYRCEWWWDYSATETHCWCEQVLTDNQIQKIDTVIEKIAWSIEEKWYTKKQKEEIYERLRLKINTWMPQRHEQREKHIFAQYILNSLYNALHK